jgi:cardiolipin synthase
VSFHFSTQDSRRALLDSIQDARKSYYVETFIWHNDEAGHEVLQALAAKKKADPDFDVKILIDGFGLRQGSGGHNDTAIVDELRKIGAEVLEYRPTWHSPETKQAVPLAYTHRKLYIADGEQFISGGRNIGNEYLKPKYKLAEQGVTEHSWHDMLFTVKGDETGRVLDEFMKNWERAGGTRPAQMPQVVPSATGTARIQSFTTDPIAGTQELWEAQSRAIQNAEREIVARYPYFSDDELVAELIRAKQAKPELNVKVLLPANKEASHEGDIYSALNKETATQLSQAGIEVRMFEGGKAMSVDGELLSIGSANADARTFNGNHELNTFIADREATRKFNAMTARDWRESRPVTLADLAPASADEAQKRGVLEALDFLL